MINIIIYNNNNNNNKNKQVSFVTGFLSAALAAAGLLSLEVTHEDTNDT